MSSYLQQQLETRMEAKNLTTYALEKKAGLKRSAARNILQGFSKKPSAEALKAIANVLECTVDDLVGPLNEKYSMSPIIKISTLSKSDYEWDERLYIDSIKAVSKIVSNKKIDLKFEQALALAREIYKYSLSKQSDKVDQDFTNWLINKNF